MGLIAIVANVLGWIREGSPEEEEKETACDGAWCGDKRMITRSNLAEQLREYQIRSKHDWASLSFFSSTSVNLSSSRLCLRYLTSLTCASVNSKKIPRMLNKRPVWTCSMVLRFANKRLHMSSPIIVRRHCTKIRHLFLAILFFHFVSLWPLLFKVKLMSGHHTFKGILRLKYREVDVAIFVIWELVVLAFIVFSAVSLYFRHLRLAIILLCITLLMLLCMKITKKVKLARRKKRRMLLPLSM
ncbi:UNVERIFIED_CONTAM: hypothetical protein Scaly_1761500 [Sesamum calycinum]|uniref:Uncharacterized protein n=1 Tax=Sesamum calycinum TaxID=2727403 RepID=A0AAW2NWY7_9LAMI